MPRHNARAMLPTRRNSASQKRESLTPMREVTGVLMPPNSPVALVFEPQVLLTVDGILTDVLDVTDVLEHLKSLGTWDPAKLRVTLAPVSAVAANAKARVGRISLFYR